MRWIGGRGPVLWLEEKWLLSFHCRPPQVVFVSHSPSVVAVDSAISPAPALTVVLIPGWEENIRLRFCFSTWELSNPKRGGIDGVFQRPRCIQRCLWIGLGEESGVVRVAFDCAGFSGQLNAQLQ